LTGLLRKRGRCAPSHACRGGMLCGDRGEAQPCGRPDMAPPRDPVRPRDCLPGRLPLGPQSPYTGSKPIAGRLSKSFTPIAAHHCSDRRIVRRDGTLSGPCRPSGPCGRVRRPRRGAGVVERGGLENRCALTRTVGSNPTPSASLLFANVHGHLLTSYISNC
jgi:hypothetical protein